MYGPEVKAEVLRQIATTTKGLKAICSAKGMPCVDTIMDWLRADLDFRNAYDEAKMLQQELEVEEMVEIADRPSKDVVEAMDKKLQIDVRKWRASKLAPKKYGDNRNVNVDVGVRRVTSAEQMMELRGAIMQKLDASKVEDIDHEDL